MLFILLIRISFRPDTAQKKPVCGNKMYCLLLVFNSGVYYF
jgi:hypothetical protein